MLRERKTDYSKLWKLLIDRKMKITALKSDAGVSTGTYAKLNRGEFLSMDVLTRICAAIDWDTRDIVEMVMADEDFYSRKVARRPEKPVRMG